MGRLFAVRIFFIVIFTVKNGALLFSVAASEQVDQAATCPHQAGHNAEQMTCSKSLSEDDDPKERWKWNPASEHRCNIRVVSYDEIFDELFGKNNGLPPLYAHPLVIRGDPHNGKFLNLTTKETILNIFPKNFNVTLSSSNSFSAHRRTIPLKQYLNELNNNTETTPDQLSNETWYLFGETYTEEWNNYLLQYYHLPPCQTCTAQLTALSFGIGNLGSGVQWHSHGPGFSQALHGRKHWVLYHSKKKPTFHPDYNSRYWMEYIYTNLSSNELPDECTLNPNDMIYFPDGWWHATINLDPYTAFISAFTTEHNVL